MSNFHPLEVVARGSETQLQVGEKEIWLLIRQSVSVFHSFEVGFTMFTTQLAAPNENICVFKSTNFPKWVWTRNEFEWDFVWFKHCLKHIYTGLAGQGSTQFQALNPWMRTLVLPYCYLIFSIHMIYHVHLKLECLVLLSELLFIMFHSFEVRNAEAISYFK